MIYSAGSHTRLKNSRDFAKRIFEQFSDDYIAMDLRLGVTPQVNSYPYQDLNSISVSRLSQRNKKLTDTSAHQGLLQLGAHVKTNLVSDQVDWFTLSALEQDKENDTETEKLKDQRVAEIRQALSSSNFYTVNSKAIVDFLTFGHTYFTASVKDSFDIRGKKRKKKKLHFRHCSVFDLLATLDPEGNVIEGFIPYTSNLSAFITNMGMHLSPYQMTLLMNKTRSEQAGHVKYTQFVVPNNGSIIDQTELPEEYQSARYVQGYVFDDDVCASDPFFNVEGLNYMPIFCSRQFTALNSPYGIGLGSLLMPHSAYLNDAKFALGVATDLACKTPIVVNSPDAIVHDNIGPGDIIYNVQDGLDGGRPLIEPITNIANPPIMFQNIVDERQVVANLALKDNVDVSKTARQTESETTLRAAQRLALLSTYIDPYAETLVKIIETVDMLMQDHVLYSKEVLDSAEDTEVKFTSYFYESQKQNKALEITQLLGLLDLTFRIDPGAAVNFDAHAAARFVLDSFNVGSMFTRTHDQVKQIQDAKMELEKAKAENEQQLAGAKGGGMPPGGVPQGGPPQGGGGITGNVSFDDVSVTGG